MKRVGNDRGFTMVELMVVVMIIGALALICVPVFWSARAVSQRQTCFANQRIVEGAAQTWSSVHDEDMSPLQGVVDADNPLVGDYILRWPPLCPSAPVPADRMVVDVAHGAYTLDASGTVQPCSHANPVHGIYR